MNHKAILLSAVLFVGIASAGHAQVVGSHAQLGSNVTGPCGNALSNSSDNNRANQNCNTATGGTASSSSAGGTVNGGSGNGTVSISNQRNAPAVVAPPVYSSNTCLGGFSAGISAPFGGLSAGGTTMDEDCTTREDAMMLYSIGSEGSAKARMCLGGDKLRKAVEFGGFDCSAVDPKPKYAGGALSHETACHEADNNHELYLASRGFCP